MSVSSSGNNAAKAEKIVGILMARFGEIPWWPGDTDEVMVGAILTQQTRWENVVRALAILKERGLCSMSAIYTADPQEIEEAVRCTGFYRIKARRLKALAAFVTDTSGGIDLMAGIPTPTLRAGLLGVHGIGEETADSILCYGFSRPSFVVDAYTERIARCAGITAPRSALKTLFESVLPEDSHVHHQTHAHIVEYAKGWCTKKRCKGCRIMALNG
ncbi:MAG: Fe-S cluster assembly protein HesB [Methanoregula sp.]|jgi:endonuclease-3 related protein|uniref:endonuclease III domain-containing protein n=1 Tax=Methanoregula sp. TaxID=2052170 RepID=UPI003D0AA164